MREINANIITEEVKKACMETNYNLPEDIYSKIKQQITIETSSIGKEILKDLINNADLARNNKVPICQDTGMVVVFAEIGEDVYIKGNITEAINKGVSQGYKEGFLRKSIVEDPLKRNNTDDNTPAVIHYDFVKGDQIKLTIGPKGFGSENMGQIKMLKPSDGEEGIIDFVLEAVEQAGPNPCPPIVVGIGIGGTMDKVAELSKKASIRSIETSNPVPYYEALETKILNQINKLGVGPQGLGGDTTALGVNIEVFPTHIAGLPVAVNINCHASRHKEIII